MITIAGLPFWELRFDAEGTPDPAQETELLQGVSAAGITDLLIFSHGWNNNPAVALRLYRGFFGLLAEQARQATQVTPGPHPNIGCVGVFWPSQRWSDEPIPDFEPVAADTADAPGAASVTVGPRARTVLAPTIDPGTLAGLREVFPAATAELDRMADLLSGDWTDATSNEFYRSLRLFTETAASGGPVLDQDDGEDDRDRTGLEPGAPGMLLDGPDELFTRYTDALRQSGAELGGRSDEGGAAGLGDLVDHAVHGAKEALRQATYWQMKNRAGTVGRQGLGPLLGRLHQRAPGLGVHLIGHSFGARLVSYALAGMPAGISPSPVKAVTLLEGAFSQWAFATKLPSDPNRSGALAGRLDRIDGPLVAVHSRFDDAVGRFYPLASMAARDDSAGIGDAHSRWGGIGANGAQGAGARPDAVRGAGPGNVYPFAPQQVLNVDASDVVRAGGPPSGAHSDIVHPELTWIVLTAGRIVA